MSPGWLAWSNPVAIWWSFLVITSAANVVFWLSLCSRSAKRGNDGRARPSAIDTLVLLCGVYVFGCAFRSVLPRADVQRICLFDTWLSSVFLGRSVATIAEICFVIQWAIVLRALGNLGHSNTAKYIAKAIVPLIAFAECCSWYAVTTTNYLGNVVENSLWTATFLLIAVALASLLGKFRGILQTAIAAATVGLLGYVIFMATVDVPMYYARWQADPASGKALFGLLAGLHDVASRWIVTRDIAAWQDEIPWMSLYFSVAVWTSLALASFGLVAHLLPRYRVAAPSREPANRRLTLRHGR